MSYEIYKILHIFGILIVLTTLGAAAFLNLSTSTPQTSPNNKLLAALHGIGLTIAIIAGFGAAGKGGMMSGGLPLGWLWTKVGIWLVFGASLTLLKRVSGIGRPALFIIPVIGAFAAWLAISKPF